MRDFLPLMGTLTLLTLAVPITPARAQLVWDNGTSPANSSGFDFSQFAMADDFVLSSDTTLTAIRFWITPNTSDLSEFSGTVGWAIHQNISGSVGPALATGTANGAGLTLTDTGVPNVAGHNIRQADFAIAPTDLPSGSYFLALREGPINSAFDGTATLWAFTDSQQGSFLRLGLDPTNPTFNGFFTSDVAFQLFGSSQSSAAAPEPGALALLGIGIAGLVVRRKR